MTYYKEQPTNVFGILARRKSGDDPRPEDEAKHATTFASGFGNQQIRDKIDQSGSPLTSVLKEKQATVVQAVQATNGEKRKLPDDSVRAPVFRRKKLTTDSSKALHSVVEKGTEEEHEQENARSLKKATEAKTLSEDATEKLEVTKKGSVGTEEKVEDYTSEEIADEMSHDDSWNDFVAKVDKKDYPKLSEYLLAKESRLAQQAKFQKALAACIMSLKACGKGMVDETSRPACAKRNKKMKLMQENITETFVSNHSRRNNYMDQLYEADRLWKNWYESLAGILLTGASTLSKSDGYTSNKDTTNDEAKTTTKDDAETISSENENENLSSDDTSPQKQGQDDEEPDWSKICEFPPAQKSVTDFLSARDEFDCAVTNADQLQTEVEEDVTQEVLELIEKIEEMLAKLECRIEDLEFDIETHIMNNHDRRADQKERVQLSAQKAQSLFSKLLSGLVQSMR